MTENYIDTVNIVPNGKLIKKIYKLGHGDQSPKIGQQVIAHYTGTLLDGTKFDSSVDRGIPFKFKIGVGQVIKAWDLSFATMKKGEKAQITATSDYAYGKRGSPPKIPPDATLIFDVELIDFYDMPKEINEMTDNERYDMAFKFKEEANKLIQTKKLYKEATNKYNDALKYLKKDISQHQNLLLSIYLNLTLTSIKTENYSSGLKFVDNVLDIDNNNLKALYRKSLLLNNLNLFEDAIKTATTLFKLNPNNTNKILMLNIKNKLKKNKIKKKKLYKKMASKLFSTKY